MPDFGDPEWRPVGPKVDFPIAPVNALWNLKDNAGKPIYQMSRRWARRRSSAFHSLPIASAVEAPDDPTKAAKLVWNHYYSNHQKAGHFKRLRVLDPFMGGGTTLVEGVRDWHSNTTANRWENGQTTPSKLAKAQLEAFCEKMIEEGRLRIRNFWPVCVRSRTGR